MKKLVLAIVLVGLGLGGHEAAFAKGNAGRG
jgi:hypothetical protein